MDELLRTDDLRVSYRDRGRVARAVDGVSLALRRGDVLAVVGESGCGKSTLALAMLGLLPANASVEGGAVLFDGRDLLKLRGEELRRVRGRRIAMVFQDPAAGLNPVLSIGTQVAEIIRAHLTVSAKAARRMAIDALGAQGLARPEQVMDAYPFQLSGGMCQRVMIAIATVLKPEVIIADEPTSSLDVTMQSAILAELDALRRSTGTAILLITHDLGVVAGLADDVAVMYAGRIVEEGGAAQIFARPHHPYMAALLAARPRLDDPGRTLVPIRGAPPDLGALAGTCAFLPRCTKAVNLCRSEPWPPLAELAPGQRAACFNPVFQAAD